MPNGANRSPDVAWVRKDRWEALTLEHRYRFPPIAPNFVMELCSATDDLNPLQAKLREYSASGVRLGCLINPQDQQVEIYHPSEAVEVKSLPANLTGEAILPDFTLTLPCF